MPGQGRGSGEWRRAPTGIAPAAIWLRAAAEGTPQGGTSEAAGAVIGSMMRTLGARRRPGGRIVAVCLNVGLEAYTAFLDKVVIVDGFEVGDVDNKFVAPRCE